MTDSPFDPNVPTVLTAEDVRRVPILGAALGCSIAATVLAFMESGVVAGAIVVALWTAVIGLLLAVLPAANTLRLDRDGFHVRSFALLRSSVPWAAVRGVETGEGWAGGALIVDLDESLADARIVGLPRDPDLGRRAFTDHYGVEAEELARLFVQWRHTALGAAT